MLSNTLFRHRIFLALVFITLLFLTAMAAINYFQNSRNFEDRKKIELQNSVNFIKEDINYQINSGKYPDAATVFQDKTLEFSNMFNLNINVYSSEGKPLASNLAHNKILKKSLINRVQKEKNFLKDSLQGDHKFYTSYTLLENRNQIPVILELNSVENKNADSSQTGILIKRYVLLVIFLLILSGFVAWLISRSLTEKINHISDKIKDTGINSETDLEYPFNDEIKPLVNSYNEMNGKIQEQKFQLQKNERSEAWKEMARQVVHEINNPLTPLRLTVQNFNRRFSPDDPENNQKVKELTKTVVHHLDVISAITKSFADYAKMPLNNDSNTNVVENIRNCIRIFPSENVTFSTNVEQIYYPIDGMYLTRIITNIVKNGMQAIPENRDGNVHIELKDRAESFIITISDNGSGISDEDKIRIFEANYTTKSEGMGLGLSMVKKIVEEYNGKIWFESQKDFGTVFFLEFIKNNHAE